VGRCSELNRGEEEQAIDPILLTPKAQLHGLVQRENGKPLANAKIKLVRSRRQPLILEADGSGEFTTRVRDLPNKYSKWSLIELDETGVDYVEMVRLRVDRDDPNSLLLVARE
jgi:hypothetical protein